MTRAVAWRQEGHLAEVIKDGSELLQFDRKDVSARFHRALIYEQKVDCGAPNHDFTEVIRLKAYWPLAYFTRGIASQMGVELDSAIKDFDEAIRLAPNASEIYKARGDLWFDKDDYSVALRGYREAIRLNADDVYSYILMAWILASCPDEKCRDGKQAVAPGHKSV